MLLLLMLLEGMKLKSSLSKDAKELSLVPNNYCLLVIDGSNITEGEEANGGGKNED